MTDVVANLVAQQKGRVEGLVCIEVRGSGAWTVDLTQGEVRAGAEEDADAALSLERAAFDQLVAGRFDAERSARDGTLVARGAPEVLERFALLLEAP